MREEKREEDEILAELTRKQAELKAVVSGPCHRRCSVLTTPPPPPPPPTHTHTHTHTQSEFNRQQLQTLVSLARTEIERQELRKESQEVKHCTTTTPITDT